MDVLITYKSGKETISCVYAKLPLKFGFGSYNEPMIVRDIPTTIFVKDIISIEGVIPSTGEYAMQA